MLLTEGSKQDSKSLCLVDCPRKDDDKLTEELIYEMHKVSVFVYLRNENHALPQGGHRLILVCLYADAYNRLATPMP